MEFVTRGNEYGTAFWEEKMFIEAITLRCGTLYIDAHCSHTRSLYFNGVFPRKKRLEEGDGLTYHLKSRDWVAFADLSSIHSVNDRSDVVGDCIAAWV